MNILFLAAVADASDLASRVVAVEHDVSWHETVAVIAFAFLGFLGWAEIRRAVQSRVRKATAEAERAVRRAHEQLAELRRRAGTNLFVESGEQEFRLTGNYISAWVSFTTRFPRIPQVFVTEANAGNWIYMKVDSREIDRFQWAGRTITGEHVEYIGRMQWVAIVADPAAERTSSD